MALTANAVIGLLVILVSRLMQVLSSSFICDKASVARCTRSFDAVNSSRYDVIRLDDVIPSWDVYELSQLCTSFEEFSMCMSPLINNCSISHQLDIEGLNNSYAYLCNTSIEYDSYQECFGGSVVRAKVSKCNDTLVDQASKLQKFSNEDKIRLICTYYGDYFDCLETAIEPLCGRNASDWQKTFVKNMYSPYLRYLHCDDSGTVVDASGWSAGSVIILVLVLLTGLLLITMIAVISGVAACRRNIFNRRRRRRRTPARSEQNGADDESTADSQTDPIDRPPAYSPPYVVYGPPGPNGERCVRIIGVAGNVGPEVVDGAFKGLAVQPPPYLDEPPPTFEQMTAAEDALAVSGPSGEVQGDRSSVNRGLVLGVDVDQVPPACRPPPPPYGSETVEEVPVDDRVEHV